MGVRNHPAWQTNEELKDGRHMERIQSILKAAKFVGLHQVLRLREAEARLNDEPVYVKLPVITDNHWNIRSVEVWYPQTKPPFFKVTHGEQVLSARKTVIDSVGRTPGLTLSSTRTYSTFEGSWITAIAALASALATDAGIELTH